MRDEKPESEKGVVISMRDVIHIINELRAYDLEREWFEFKVNWYKADELGEYPNLPKLLYIGFKLIPQIPYKIGV